ncbi:hypothetical protein BH23ACT2_BH23ACT2_18040 [soil metagenome]
MATFVAECYWPGVTQETLRAARARVRAATPERPGAPVHFLGVLLIVADEVAFWRFEADAPEVVHEVSRAAGLSFDRILECRELPAAS